ncbi:MAG: LapA family protein [Porticoccaceae bacterium]|nr:LapA family protein [Pseudomonadales bacterium]MCP5171928.1 LapA family protein [Pseudomonadales bacterium]
MSVRKFFYTLLLSALLLFVVQNMAQVTVSFLWWEFNLPRVIILAVTFVLGALTGYGLFEIRHFHKKR